MVGEMTDVLPSQVENASPKHGGLGKVSWALADQALISATNFITIILLARGLTQEGLGEFTLVYSALLFVNSIQAGIITQPHNILGVNRHGRDYQVYTTSTAVSQLLLAGVAAALTLAAWGIAKMSGWFIAPLLLALAPTIVAWQLQELVRKVLYTEAREAKALAVDIIGYGGQIVAIVMLGHYGKLTATTTLYAIAITSAAATVYGWWEIRHSLCLQADRKQMLGNWHFGKWIAGGEIVGHWMSAQLFIYLAAAMLTAAAAGVLRIVHTVLGPCRVLADVLCTVLPIRFARAYSASGEAGLRTQLAIAYLVSVPVLGIYCLVVAVFARPVLHAFFGGRYDDSATVLAIYSLAAFASYMMMILGAALRARRLTRELFDGQLYASLVSLPIGWLLIRLFGVKGTALGMLVTYLAMIVLFYRAYRGARTGAQDRVADQIAGSGALFSRIVALFDQAQVPYCITHGYETYPEVIGSDVDLVMPRAFVRDRLAKLLDGNAELLGARIVQWLHEDTYYIVLMGREADGSLAHLCLDISVDYTLKDRLFLTADEVLASRRRHGAFWVPSVEIEFACLLLRRMAKGRLDEAQAGRLSELYREDPAAADEQIARFFPAGSVRLLREASRSGEWDDVRGEMVKIRTGLLARATRRDLGGVSVRNIGRSFRRLDRHARPRHGLHVVFLGPDGAGKSSIVRSVKQDLAPAFFATNARSFPPALLNRGDPDMITQPHAEAPRSWTMSAVRAVAYWWTYHAPGHFATVRADLARGRLVLHDRHLLDVQVDPRRYRYAGPMNLVRWICRFTPRADMVIVLDAPTEVIQSRKQEVAPEETARQCAGYRELARKLGSRAAIVNAARSLPECVADVESLVLERMAERVRRQLRLAESAARCDQVRAIIGDAFHAVAVREIGAGDQAHLYEVSAAGEPRVVKLFRRDRPEAASAVEEEFASLQRLRDTLDGVVIEGWRICTPRPVAESHEHTGSLAVIMDGVPGRPLQSLLAEQKLSDDRAESIARVLASALRRYWTTTHRIYGDFNLDNVLCDPEGNRLSLVDPGIPLKAFDCGAVDRHWYPASRDLAYIMFDTATSIRSSMFQPDLRRRQWELVSNLLEAAVGAMATTPETRRGLVDEIGGCCHAHLRRISTPLSPRGMGRRLVQLSAAVRMNRLLRRLAADVAAAADESSLLPTRVGAR